VNGCKSLPPGGRRQRRAAARGGGRAPGWAVQVDPISPTLKAPGTQRLTLKCGESLSTFGFKFNLRRYSLVLTWGGKLAGRQEEVFTLREGEGEGGDALSRELTLIGRCRSIL